ncbi:MAG: hypothetical protein EOM64_03225 [Erysipelotrichia bacterium]|nr:hypothetical protein [Erysipelotrichia bacterium]
MTKRALRIILAASASFSLAACSGTAAATPAATPSATPAAAEPTAAADKISYGFLKTEGDTIVLRGNPTTGYDWKSFYVSTADQEIVKIEDADIKVDSSLDGAPSTYTFKITGLKAGDARIGFNYMRSFDEYGVNETVYFTVHADDSLNVTIDSIPDQPTVDITENQISLFNNPTYGYSWTAYFPDGGETSCVDIAEPEYVSGTTGVDDEGGTDNFVLTGNTEGSVQVVFSWHTGMDADGLAYEIHFTCTVDKDMNVAIQMN